MARVGSLGLKVLCVLLLLGVSCGPKPDRTGSTKAIVRFAIGNVTVLRKNAKKWRKAKLGAELFSHDIVKTGPESKAELEIVGQGKMSVGENSIITLAFPAEETPTKSNSVVLAAGNILCNMEKIAGGRSFNVHTPTATAAIRGTGFEVVVNVKTGESSVKVLKGKVAVRKRKTLKRVWQGVAEPIVLAVDFQNAAQTSRFMTALSFDVEIAQEERIREQIEAVEQRLSVEAQTKGLSPEQAEKLVVSATDKLRLKIEELQVEEIILERGRAAEVRKRRPKVLARNLTGRELNGIRQRHGAERVREAIAVPDPPAATSSAPKPNTLPVVSSKPTIESYVNSSYSYKVTAQDDDADILNFSLVEAPKGMTIAALTGEMLWEPETTGTFQVNVKVDDNKGGIANQQFAVRVRESIRGKLDAAPVLGGTNTVFHFDGSKTTDRLGPRSSLRFRWDLDGDGKWDLPDSKNFGRKNQVTRQYAKSGVYEARMEVRNRKGITQALSIAVVVDNPPKADFEVTPEFGDPGSEFVLDAGKSHDDGDLQYRWDFDGNGKWDTDFASESTVKRVFKDSKRMRTVLEVKDTREQTSTARGAFVVSYACKADAGPDQKGNLKASIRLAGEAKDPDNPIVATAWDFDGNGKIDWKGKVDGTATHVYGKEGSYSAVFMVRSQDGSKAKDTTTITIFNAPPKASAGKDMATKVNAKTALKGKGNDPDGKIAKYEWDFDGDGEFDWGSAFSAEVEYVYAKAGKYKALLQVTSQDGKKATDTIVVSVSK